MARAWIGLDDALDRKRKPFPRPWRQLGEFSGCGNIGAEMQFGTVHLEGTTRQVPAIVIIFNVHKDVVGPLMHYWFCMWHKTYGYVEFDIRWIWEFLGESEPEEWRYFDKPSFKQFVLNQLGWVRETFLRCPEDRRNELVEAIGTGKLLEQALPWPGKI